MQAVMITMEGREDSALATAEGLAAADVDTEIFVQPADWPVGGASNNRNSRRALTWALENAAGAGVLFVEDDIVIKPDRFKRALAAADETAELMYFYMHDVQPRVEWYPKEPWMAQAFGPPTRRGRPYSSDTSELVVPEGPRRMGDEVRMYGSQCVYIPRPYVRFLIEHMGQSHSYSDKITSSPTAAIDTSLNNWRASNRLPVYCYLPHPVQHLQNRSRRQGTRLDVYSRSFDIASDIEVGHA